jgi:spermidine synthase
VTTAARFDRTYAATAACFVLSGVAGLLYQTIWSRQYSLVLGTSEAAVSVVLAVYMLGLALGAALVPRWMHGPGTRPLRLFALLELGIAACALAIPPLLALVGDGYVAVAGGLPDPPSAVGALPRLYFALACLLLLVPTMLMGATLPVLAGFAVRSAADTGPRIAGLYAANTLGAAAGALAGGWWLVPDFGLRISTAVAMALNLLVTAGAFAVSRSLAEGGATTATGTTPAAAGTVSAAAPATTGGVLSDERVRALLPLLGLVSGFVALTYEVLWARMLSHALGSSLAAFSTMLASFLLGIGLGSLASTRRLSAQGAALAFAATQVGVAVAAAAAQLWLGRMPNDLPPGPLATRALLAMLPATLFMGAAFPLLIRLLGDRGVDPTRATGRIYAFNTVGAVAGAIAAGMWLIPALSFEGTARLTVALSLAAAVVALWSLTDVARPMKAAATAAALAAALLFRPPLPGAIIDASLVDDSTAGEQRFLAVGRSATVLVKERDDGGFYLRTNGLPEATVRRAGAPPVRHSQRWLAALPIAARPEATSMLVVGLGGGVAVEDIPARFTTLDVVELEPRVIDANASFARLRAHDPLADPRLRLIENDARNALVLTDRRYDILVSQPSHPWTSGSANLYSRGFLELARSRLTPDGVLLVWINAQFIDEALLRDIAATITAVFPQVRLYRPERMELMFLASAAPLEPERLALGAGSALQREADYFAGAGINAAEDIAASLTAADAGMTQLAVGGRMITDDRNQLATDSSPTRGGFTPESLDRLLRDVHAAQSATGGALAQLPLDAHYLGDRLVTLGFAETAAAFAAARPAPGGGAPPPRRDDAAGISTFARGLEASGRRDDAAALRRAAAERFPDDAALRFAALRPRLLDAARAAGRGTEPLQGLPDSARAVLEGWRHAADGEWDAVRALEPRLAAARTVDGWHPEATQLRIEWRTRAGGDDRMVRAREALQLVDRMIARRPASDLFILRASAALSLGDGAAFLESASAFAADALAAPSDAGTSAAARAVVTARVEGFSRAIADGVLPFDPQRAAAVLRQLEQARSRS